MRHPCPIWTRSALRAEYRSAAIDRGYLAYYLAYYLGLPCPCQQSAAIGWEMARSDVRQVSATAETDRLEVVA